MKMTEVTQQQEPEVNEVDQLKQQLADAQKAIEALASKKDELLKETKAAKEEKRKQAELVEQAKEAQLATAAKNGEFESLWKQAQEELQRERAQRDDDRKNTRKQTIENEAMKIAVDLAKDDKKAVLLKRFLADSLSNVADDYGQVEQDVLKSVRQQFETDELYAALRAGNMSVGGSAPGNNKSTGGTTQSMTRAEFNKIPIAKQSEYMGKVIKGQAKLVD